MYPRLSETSSDFRCSMFNFQCSVLNAQCSMLNFPLYSTVIQAADGVSSSSEHAQRKFTRQSASQSVSQSVTRRQKQNVYARGKKQWVGGEERDRSEQNYRITFEPGPNKKNLKGPEQTI